MNHILGNEICGYLPNTFQNPDSDEVTSSQISGYWSQQGEDHSAKDAKTKEPLGTIFACQVATWYLSKYISIEKRAQDPALSLRIPVIHTGLLRY